MYMLHELMYMHMFTNTIVFRDERNVKITSFFCQQKHFRKHIALLFTKAKYTRLDIRINILNI